MHLSNYPLRPLETLQQHEHAASLAHGCQMITTLHVLWQHKATLLIILHRIECCYRAVVASGVNDNWRRPLLVIVVTGMAFWAFGPSSLTYSLAVALCCSMVALLSIGRHMKGTWRW
jgi:hypothetical protein